jgi:hypothetical protein
MFSNFVYSMVVIIPIMTFIVIVLVITNRVGLTAILILSIKVYYLQKNNMKISDISNTEVADEENIIENNIRNIS